MKLLSEIFSALTKPLQESLHEKNASFNAWSTSPCTWYPSIIIAMCSRVTHNHAHSVHLNDGVNTLDKKIVQASLNTLFRFVFSAFHISCNERYWLNLNHASKKCSKESEWTTSIIHNFSLMTHKINIKIINFVFNKFEFIIF